MKRLLLTIALLFLAPWSWATGIDYAALKTELLTDPAGIGYAASVTAGNDTETARIINAVRTVPPVFTINRGPIPSFLAKNAIVRADWTLVSPSDQNLLALILSSETVDMSDANTRASLGGIFPAGSTTRNNFIALANRAASRAEVYPGSPGAGTTISVSDVALALR